MLPTARREVVDSWCRSAAAGVDVDSVEPTLTLSRKDLLEHRRSHPLSTVYPLLEEVLGQAARGCGALLALSDEAGQLLWVSGASSALRQAEAVGFVEGANWDERLSGTNAPGTALALGRPLVVNGEDHYRSALRPFNCSASPIHDPGSGSVIGVLDITGGLDVAVPQTLAMVRAAARLAETELARQRLAAPTSVMSGGHPEQMRPGGPSSDSFQLQVLGRREGVLRRGDRALMLSPRHTEILLLLAGAPRGLSGEELALLLYSRDVTGSTVRAELNRLRRLLGEEVLASRPYRLDAGMAGDWHAVQAHLAAGDVGWALRDYVGPVLPHSVAPGIEDVRAQLQEELRHAVLRSGRVDLMAVWTRSSWGDDDYEMWAAQRRLLPTGSPMQSLVRAQLARLDRDYGLAAPGSGLGPVRGDASMGRAQV
ncbi:MAG: GAF domain-containing protein [Ornithinimicrobium sp.]|uniref:GAF domain-containing protein n=1 Tax=Ornithinimicrobium sp. TaxID=1977084 RepID=UPI003D9B2465